MHSKKTNTKEQKKTSNHPGFRKNTLHSQEYSHTENKPKQRNRKNSERHSDERKENEFHILPKKLRKEKNKKSNKQPLTTASEFLGREKKKFTNKHYKISEQQKPKSHASASENTLIRLNRYIANSGVCSRRQADELIKQGLITVNGKTITELGYKVSNSDQVRYDGRLLYMEKKVYILLNKPKDYITTTNDPQERKTVMHLVAGATKERIFPVGRLDRNTTGLLLFTNDGELAEKLAHPSRKINKIYQVELNTPISEEDFKKIKKGKVYLEDGRVQVDDIEILNNTRKSLGLSIHEGRNRIVRRLFEKLGYEIVKLDRTMYAGLTKKNLPRGRWRFLTQKEIIKLKSL